MKRIAMMVLVVFIIVTLAFLWAASASEPASKPESKLAAEPPADRVVVMYFHRTKRCPTCLKMGSYSEEAVEKEFAKLMKKGEVEFHCVDFQNKKNAAIVKGYQIGGPTLIVAKIEDQKVEEFKNLKEIWSQVGDKPAFLKYVRENVAAYLKSTGKEGGTVRGKDNLPLSWTPRSTER
jgi:hypothetical protein